MSRQASAVVTQVSPLQITMFGDETHPIPALQLSTYTATVGDQVRVEVRRSGLLPIVQGAL